jgi:2,3-bisphosphoglycerate-dependent phosphoglycerate mutase
MKKTALVLCILTASTLAAAPHPVTTVILVRHAEKATTERDTPLSEAGRKRAEELARVLTGVKIDAVFTTEFQRTKQTGAPTAQALGLTPVVRNTGPTYAVDLATEIRKNHVGKTVLVVGHSDTTITVMEAFGATGLPRIDEPHFDNLFVLTDVAGAAPKVVALRYGASR